MVKGDMTDMGSIQNQEWQIQKSTSSKSKKVLRLSPKSKKKTRSKDCHTMRDMEGQGACKHIGNDALPNGFSDKEIHELKQAFDLFDKNNDGKISCEELGCVLRSLGHEYSQGEVEEMIKNADKNENGFVEYDEFLILMKRWAANHAARAEQSEAEEKTKETFKVFDMDGNGYIDKHELRYVMRRLGENLEEEDIKAMFQLADLNGDGLIDFEEFSKLMGGLSFPLFPKESASGEATAHSSSRDMSTRKN